MMTDKDQWKPAKVGSANQKIESHEFFLQLLQYVGCVEVFLKPP